jgi:hypothetical protein
MSTETKPAEWMLEATGEILIYAGRRIGANISSLNEYTIADIIAKHAPSLEREAIEALRMLKESIGPCFDDLKSQGRIGTDTARNYREQNEKARAILARYATPAPIAPIP